MSRPSLAFEKRGTGRGKGVTFRGPMPPHNNEGSLSTICGPMKCGKTTLLLQKLHDYESVGIKCLVFIPEVALGDRFASVRGTTPGDACVGPTITSRSGLSHDVVGLGKNELVSSHTEPSAHADGVVFVDEAQFLTREQVDDLATIAETTHVWCFGLRSDSNGVVFEGMSRLFAICDDIQTLNTICRCSGCGRTATMTVRRCSSVSTVAASSHEACVDVGGDDKYEVVCRRHFFAMSSPPTSVQ